MSKLGSSERILEWLRAEEIYFRHKFMPYEETEDSYTRDIGMMGDPAVGDMGWTQRIDMYLNRANILGLGTDGGRQAAAKVLGVAFAMVASIERVHGSLPQGGWPSGEIRDWPESEA